MVVYELGSGPSPRGICWHLDLELFSFQNYETQMSVVEAIQCMVFLLFSLKGLRYRYCNHSVFRCHKRANSPDEHLGCMPLVCLGAPWDWAVFLLPGISSTLIIRFCTHAFQFLQIKSLKRKQNQIKSLPKQIDPIKSFPSKSWQNKCVAGARVFWAVKQGKGPRWEKTSNKGAHMSN